MINKTFYCIDAHTCGNPVRVVAGGGPILEGENMMEKRLHFLEDYDWIRKGLMFEPRGHDMMSGSILYPPSDKENDIGILFIETSGCLPMCGHGTIGTVTVMIEQGLVIPKVPGHLRLETPAGLVLVEYRMEGKKVKSVKLTNVPSFLHSSGLKVHCDGLGDLTVDVSYGGNFYAIVDRQENFPGIQEFNASQIVEYSRKVRKAVNENHTFLHPQDQRINGCSHVLWDGEVMDPSSTARNAVFYGDKAIDRSPCGTGTSARMAQWAANGKLKEGEDFIHESVIGSTFTGRIVDSTEVGEYPAIIPSIEGWARITGFNQIIIDDEDDPYAGGFQVI
jgi:4-hydroxyproline epimerase